MSVYELFAKVASKYILIRHSTVYNIIINNKFDNNNSIDVIIEYVMYAVCVQCGLYLKPSAPRY